MDGEIDWTSSRRPVLSPLGWKVKIWHLVVVVLGFLVSYRREFVSCVVGQLLVALS